MDNWTSFASSTIVHVCAGSGCIIQLEQRSVAPLKSFHDGQSYVKLLPVEQLRTLVNGASQLGHSTCRSTHFVEPV